MSLSNFSFLSVCLLIGFLIEATADSSHFPGPLDPLLPLSQSDLYTMRKPR